MSTVHAARLAGPTEVNGTSSATVWTVPAGFRGLVRTTLIYNQSSSTVATVNYGINGTTAALRIAHRVIGTLSVDEGVAWYVLDEGETLEVTVTTSTKVTISLFGYLLELP